MKQQTEAEQGTVQEQAPIDQLFRAISSILIAVGPDNRILRWNHSAEATFGRAESEVRGKCFEESAIRWDLSRVLAGLAECRATRRSVRLDDVAFERDNGSPGLLGITLNPITQDGELIGILIQGADITTRRLLQSEVAHTQKLEAIGQLAAGIAHEINTPTQYSMHNMHFLQQGMATILTLLTQHHELLRTIKHGTPAPEQLAAYEAVAFAPTVEFLLTEIPRAIDQSLEGLRRVSKLVQAAKTFSHPGVDERTPIDLNEAIESTVTISRNEWKYVADIELDLDPQLPLVPCQPGEMNQIILNILINATHAIAEVVGDGSEGKGLITISTYNRGDVAEIRVRDTGCGIPASARSHVFEPFFTTKPPGRGTGQGLALCHAAIKRHRGTITFESTVGTGTTFIIRLPLDVNPDTGPL